MYARGRELFIASPRRRTGESNVGSDRDPWTRWTLDVDGSLPAATDPAAEREEGGDGTQRRVRTVRRAGESAPEADSKFGRVAYCVSASVPGSESQAPRVDSHRRAPPVRRAMTTLSIDLDTLAPDERRDLANALLRAAWSAVLVETRTLLLDLLVDADPDVVGEGP